jgi:hypothetical protein
VLPFYHDFYPPNQLADAESELKIVQLKNHILLWPKALIWLNTAFRSEASQERVTPPVASAAPSQGKVAPPFVPEAREQRPDTPPAYDPPEHDGAMDVDQAPIDTFIADLEANDAPRHVPNQGRGPLAKKLMFSSQEMPEEQAAAFTAPPQSMILPKTLFVLTKEEMQQKGTLLCNKKKERKRKNKGEAALMTHKYRWYIVVLSINKSVEPNEEQKVLMSDFDQGFTVNTSKRVISSIW